MADNSKIEWTDATWNPVRDCTKVSAGCKHCYAETFAERWRGIKGHPFEFGFDLRLVPEKLADPLKWKTPSRIFVNSMSDVFHEDVPEDYIAHVASVMRLADWHTYQILTKRPKRMEKLLTDRLHEAASAPHIWWGVIVEYRKHGLPRIDDLRRTGAAMKFLPIDPLIVDVGSFDLTSIDWVIVWGEVDRMHAQRLLSQNFLSSSNNGTASKKAVMVAISTVAPTTSFQNSFVDSSEAMTISVRPSKKRRP